MNITQHEKNLETLISDREKIKNISPDKETPDLDKYIEAGKRILKEKLDEQWQG